MKLLEIFYLNFALFPEDKLTSGLLLDIYPIPFAKKGKMGYKILLYQQSAASLADIENKTKLFINQTRAERRLKVYALNVTTDDIQFFILLLLLYRYSQIF